GSARRGQSRVSQGPPARSQLPVWPGGGRAPEGPRGGRLAQPGSAQEGRFFLTSAGAPGDKGPAGAWAESAGGGGVGGRWARSRGSASPQMRRRFMRRVVLGLLSVLVAVAILAPPALAQSPTPKVTISGVIDEVVNINKNMNVTSFERFTRGGVTQPSDKEF